MRVLYLCLACFYVDGYNYQENILANISKKNGHDVKIIASTETFIDNQRLGYVEPKSYITEYGVPIVRLPYKIIINHKISTKLRIYKRLFDEIDKFNPDIIFSHDLCFLSLKDVIDYLKLHKNVVLLGDTHTALNNSGRNWISMNILHKIIYKYCINKALPFIKKIYYIGTREKDFSLKVYKIPREKLEYLPLGGMILNKELQEKYRKELINEMGFSDNAIICTHSGKIDKYKKTDEVIKAFSNIKDERLILLIYGNVQEELKQNIFSMIKQDERIFFLGWLDANEQKKVLGATDLYIQPGSCSATAQIALCNGCALIANREYQNDMKESIYYAENSKEIEDILCKVVTNRNYLYEMKKKGYAFAKETLDYEVLVKRFLK